MHTFMIIIIIIVIIITMKETERYTCLFVILLDSIINVDKKYYPQVFLIECKYAIKNKSVMNVIREL